ncbi:MAG: hypothetical protein KJ646_05710 [Nanoarchaeota archaeon]|nr:hypothetical protein [Nanoarchaeota archaeon]
MANKINSTNLLMLVAIVAVGFATINLIITIDKIGDIQTLTGYAVDTAWANLTILSNVIVNFTTENVSWGSGYVPSGSPSCELDTQGNTNCTGFVTVSTGLILENIGNEDVSLNLSSSKAAAAFIGGVSPAFQWNVSEAAGNAGACGAGALNISSWTDITTAHQIACNNFTFLDARDAFEIDLRIVIPVTASTDAKGATITATATALA